MAVIYFRLFRRENDIVNKSVTNRPTNSLADQHYAGGDIIDTILPIIMALYYRIVTVIHADSGTPESKLISGNSISVGKLVQYVWKKEYVSWARCFFDPRYPYDFSIQNNEMENYRDLNGDSGINGFGIAITSMKILFNTGIYT